MTKNSLGLCSDCKREIRLDKIGLIREHKNRYGAICKGSASKPLSQQALLEELVEEEVAKLEALKELKTFFDKPINLDTVMELSLLIVKHFFLVDSSTYIRLVSGPLGDYIRSLTEEQWNQCRERMQGKENDNEEQLSR